MNLNEFYLSVLEQDNAPIVLCDINHIIVYMNPAAISNYAKWGGAELLGKSLLACHNPNSVDAINRVVAWFGENSNNNTVHTFYNDKQNKDVYMIALRDAERNLIGYYEKHEYRTKDDTPFYHMQ